MPTVIPTRPPPPPPHAPAPVERHPPTDPPPPDDAEDRGPASPAPLRAPSKRDGGRNRPYHPTPPGGHPLVLDRGRSSTGYQRGAQAGLHASGYTALIDTIPVLR